MLPFSPNCAQNSAREEAANLSQKSDEGLSVGFHLITINHYDHRVECNKYVCSFAGFSDKVRGVLGIATVNQARVHGQL
jgi:hypothetical protein